MRSPSFDLCAPLDSIDALNRECFCLSLDRDALAIALDSAVGAVEWVVALPACQQESWRPRRGLLGRARQATFAPMPTPAMKDGEPDVVINETYHLARFDAQGYVDWATSPAAQPHRRGSVPVPDNAAWPTAAERERMHAMLFTGTGSADRQS